MAGKYFAAKLYNTLALPVLYGSETWTVIARDVRRITAAEMKYTRTAEFTSKHYKTNSQFAKKLERTLFLYKLLE